MAVAKTAGIVEIRAHGMIDPSRAVAPAAPPGLERAGEKGPAKASEVGGERGWAIRWRRLVLIR
eukprot:15481911-Alexandrium_andersonii.AAC.1